MCKEKQEEIRYPDGKIKLASRNSISQSAGSSLMITMPPFTSNLFSLLSSVRRLKGWKKNRTHKIVKSLTTLGFTCLTQLLRSPEVTIKATISLVISQSKLMAALMAPFRTSGSLNWKGIPSLSPLKVACLQQCLASCKALSPFSGDIQLLDKPQPTATNHQPTNRSPTLRALGCDTL